MRGVTIIILLLAAGLGAEDIPGAKANDSFAQVERRFVDPDMLYAPFVFWFWDKPIDSPQVQAELADMARKMIEQGLNPGYVHARFNMVGEADLPFEQWLSPAWFAAMDGVLIETKKTGAYLGFVNEYWWPSGRAAGWVLENNPDLWAESICWKTINVQGGTAVHVPKAFFVVAARRREAGNGRPDSGFQSPASIVHKTEASRLIDDEFELTPHNPALIESASLRVIGEGGAFEWTAPESGAWRIYVFNKYYHPGCDGGRLNYLDRRLAAAFLQQAHEPYAAHFGEELGASMPGVFIDHEGDYGYKLAWSRDLAGHYRKKTGEDIRINMPLLIDEDVEGRFVAARWDWFDAVSDLYVEFFKEVNQWCVAHNMYAISNLWEESLMWQASAVGDFFKAQRAFSLPGTDALGLNILKPHDFMETKSVCEFEGRRMQCEIMGGSGFWGFNNITIKQAANAAIAWGVSHIVPHAIWATRTLDGNPWLPDWFNENPWWPQMHLWSDFVRRASYINSQGHSAADVLLLNPMDSVWGWCGPGVFDPTFKGRVPVPAVAPLQTDADIPRTPAEVKKQSAWWVAPNMNSWYSDRVHQIDSLYSQVIDELVAYRIEFLVADRHYMRQMRIKQKELVREPFRFKSVILPGMDFMPLDVARKVLKFARRGGRVYVLDSWPRGSTEVGLGDPKMAKLVARLQSEPTVTFCDSSLIAELQKKPPQLRSHLQFVRGEFDMLQQHRRIDGRDFFWLANNTGKSQRCVIRVAGPGKGLQKWDCETGKKKNIRTGNDSVATYLDLDFDPYEAFWIVESPPVGYCLRSPQTSVDILFFEKPWRVRIDPAHQPPVEHAAHIPAAFLDGVDKEPDLWSKWGLEAFSGVVTYASSFLLPDDLGTTLLSLGAVHVAATVWINDQLVGERLWPPYEFDIRPFVQSGRNSIKIKVGNLLNNSYGDARHSGLYGPVKIVTHHFLVPKLEPDIRKGTKPQRF